MTTPRKEHVWFEVGVNYIPTKPFKSQLNTQKTRKCLKCDKMFESTHRGNRVCEHCKENSFAWRQELGKKVALHWERWVKS